MIVQHILIKKFNSKKRLNRQKKENEKNFDDVLSRITISLGVISIFTSDMKQGKYDKIDLSRSIYKGNIKDSSFSKRAVLKTLFYDLKDRFNKYGRRRK